MIFIFCLKVVFCYKINLMNYKIYSIYLILFLIDKSMSNSMYVINSVYCYECNGLFLWFVMK